ncbi:MAG: MFS transporter [Planctomycetaceae bacterium]|nr:MFS transporter [Planctomycetaceae bacterium]
MDRDFAAGPDGAVGAEKAWGRERVILAVLASVQFTSIVDFMVVMPLGPQLMQTLAISPAQFGWVVSSYTFSASVAGLLASSLIDRFDRRVAYLTLYAGFLVGTLLCGLASGYAALLGARIITGAFGGILGGMAMAIIGDVFPESRRGTATGSLMSAFALASTVGLPFGLFLGTRYGWHAPFFMLVGLGSTALLVGVRALPPLRGHLNPSKPAGHPVSEMVVTLFHPNHLRAFALVVALMFGGFAVIPYISAYLVANVGVPVTRLPLVYLVGGGLTLVAAPVVGKLADRHGKLRVYCIAVPASAVLMIGVTNLPRVPVAVAVLVVGLNLMGNASRMVVAMAMIMASVEPRRRGSFMSANSSVQQLATGLGAFVGGQIIVKASDGSLRRFDWVGYLAVAATLLSLALAARLRVAGPVKETSPGFSLGAADDAIGDPGDPLAAVESA